MPYPVLAVANYFIDLARKDKKKLTPMQLQKLVYFAHGWRLGLTGNPLVNEKVEAWQYGPVFPVLYGALKEYGGGPVTNYATETQFVNEPVAAWRRPRLTARLVIPTLGAEASPYDTDLLKRIWTVYGKWSAGQLSNATHEADGPWDTTINKNGGHTGADIPQETIREYFRKRATGEQ